MKTSLIITTLLFSFIFEKPKVDTTVSENTSNLTVRIDEIKKKAGPMVFVLFNSNDGFPNKEDKAYKLDRINDYNESASHTFQSIPFGNYAIMVYQDQDNDGELDTNFIEIPKEPAAMSNMTKMGKPSFTKCLVEVKNEIEKVSLSFIND